MTTQYQEPTEEQARFLFALQNSGVTNMWGAPTYVQQRFDLPKKEAEAITFYWMKHWSELNEQYNGEKDDE